MSTATRAGRLSTLQAAMVMARRDFVAVLFSRSFFFFLLGPLFMLTVVGLAGGVGKQVRQNTERPQLGLAMTPADTDAMVKAHGVLAAQIGPAIPELVVVRRLAPGEQFDPLSEI